MALGTYLGHKQEWIKDVLSSDTGVLHLSVVSGNYGVPVTVCTVGSLGHLMVLPGLSYMKKNKSSCKIMCLLSCGLC